MHILMLIGLVIPKIASLPLDFVYFLGILHRMVFTTNEIVLLCLLLADTVISLSCLTPMYYD